jgi:hypothetical protein
LRAQTSQAIKSFDGTASSNTAAARNTSSSSGYHHVAAAKAFLGTATNGGLDALRRKTTHMPPNVHLNNQRRELVKVGQKLTSENNSAQGTGKATSFIVQGTNAQPTVNADEEKAALTLNPQQIHHAMTLTSGGNAQSSASLH